MRQSAAEGPRTKPPLVTKSALRSCADTAVWLRKRESTISIAANADTAAATSS